MYYNSFLYLVFYFFNQVLTENLTTEQNLLKKLTGEDFSKREAEYLWMRISDHKWYISERLGRDVGLTVAAVDYLENIYESGKGQSKLNRFNKSNLQVKDRLSSFA
jgi:hypothetical protein